MRKNILIIWFLLSSILFFTSCESNETEDLSKDYNFEFKTGPQLIVQLNGTYTDPGYFATFDGQDISKDIIVEGKVDPQTVGLYPIKYTFKHKNGVRVTRVRNVIVCDVSVKVDISGDFVTAEGTHRIRKGVETAYSSQEISIKKIAPGFFQVQDFLGGYYAQPPIGYGNAYAASGFVQVKNDNTISFLSANMLPWGVTVTGIENGKYNPNDGTVYWESKFAGMTFYVKLKSKSN